MLLLSEITNDIFWLFPDKQEEKETEAEDFRGSIETFNFLKAKRLIRKLSGLRKTDGHCGYISKRDVAWIIGNWYMQKKTMF